MTNPAASTETEKLREAGLFARLGAASGTLLVVANMIGVGVFTTTGYMAGEIPSPPAILLAWLVGGVAALCGALTYAELGAALPRNGGEYRLLSRIYHPAVGFTAGWVSLIVGFSAPLALFAHVFGTYLHELLGQVPPILAGLCLILACTLLHAVHVDTGTRSHNVFTVFKVGLILVFIVAGILRGETSRLTVETQQPLAEAILSSAFAVQLVYVSFSYTGWNAAAYLAGEFRRPQRDIPVAMLAGVGAVMALYLGLNVVFLMSAPLTELSGQEKVAHLAAVHLFGPNGGRMISTLIAAGLVSTVSANLLAGSRVCAAIGADFAPLGFLNRQSAHRGPVLATALLAGVSALMLVTSSFDGLLKYIGVTLSLSAAVTVLGAVVLRWREPELPRPYRTWGYPLTPIVFLALESWMIFLMVKTNPSAAAYGAITIALGLVLYGVLRISTKPQAPAEPARPG